MRRRTEAEDPALETHASPIAQIRTAAKTDTLRCCVVEVFLFSSSFFVFLPVLFFYVCSRVEWQSVGSRAQRLPLYYCPGCVAMWLFFCCSSLHGLVFLRHPAPLTIPAGEGAV